MGKTFQKNSVLIIRLTAIGDIVLSSPVASALKHTNPRTKVVWLVHPLFAPLVTGHPDIDQVIEFDVETWERLWRRKNLIKLMAMARSLREILKRHHFERAIDLQGNTLSGILAALSGAVHRIALGSVGTNSWFMTKTISRNLGEQIQIGSEYRYLINQLGCSDAEWKMYVPADKAAERKATMLIRDKLGNKEYAVICPFAKQVQKNWFEDYWEQLVLRLRSRYQLATIILGRSSGRALGDRIAKSSEAINLAGSTSIIEAAAIIKNAALVVGVDTGMTHIGHAVGVPCISLFGATCPYAYVESENSKVIFLDRHCSPCRQHPTCRGRYECMREITPDVVLTTIKPLMKSQEKSIPAPFEINE